MDDTTILCCTRVEGGGRGMRRDRDARESLRFGLYIPRSFDGERSFDPLGGTSDDAKEGGGLNGN